MPTFAQLVDVEKLQELMDRFYAATVIPVGIIGVDGVIHVATGWQDICTKFHRVHPGSLARCHQSDAYIRDHLHTGGYVEYRCANGMRDIAVPLVIAGEHLATLFLGQFFCDDEVPDREFFREQAASFGFDEDEYLAALDKVPFFSREKVNHIMDYYTFFVEFLMQTGLTNLKQLEAEQALLMSKQALRESEERYRAMFEQCPDDVVIVDPHSLELVEFNTAAHTRLGYTKEEFMGLTLSDFVEGVTKEHMAARERVLREEGSAVFEFRDRTKGGEIRDVIVSVRRLEIADRPLDHCVIKDVTELKRMREELEKTQKLESLGVLAGGIAHDFNNFLAGIQGNLSIVRMLLPEEGKAQERIDRCEKAVDQATRLTRQLLTFARGGAPVKKTIDARTVIGDSVALVLRGSKVVSRCDLASDLWPVEADPAQLGQGINNLLINAHQAMPDGGVVSISAANRTVSRAEVQPGNPERYVVLTVRDPGEGIAPEHVGRIFDPYFTTRTGASGLGLTVLYSIVKKHGGQVKVFSAPGEGSTFEVWLPACAPEADETAPLACCKAGGGGCVMVMDDEEMIRDMAEEMLTLLGYQVKTCCDGAELIKHYLQYLESGRRPVAAIIDLTVPGGMGGVEAASHIRAADPSARLIVSSGYSNDAALSNYGEYGFAEALAKPFRVEALRKALSRLHLAS